MSSSVFTDKSTEPNASQLANALGATAPIWSELRDHLEAEYGPLVDEWKFYGKKAGWLKKTLVEIKVRS